MVHQTGLEVLRIVLEHLHAWEYAQSRANFQQLAVQAVLYADLEGPQTGQVAVRTAGPGTADHIVAQWLSHQIAPDLECLDYPAGRSFAGYFADPVVQDTQSVLASLVDRKPADRLADHNSIPAILAILLAEGNRQERRPEHHLVVETAKA